MSNCWKHILYSFLKHRYLIISNPHRTHYTSIISHLHIFFNFLHLHNLLFFLFWIPERMNSIQRFLLSIRAGLPRWSSRPLLPLSFSCNPCIRTISTDRNRSWRVNRNIHILKNTIKHTFVVLRCFRQWCVF